MPGATIHNSIFNIATEFVQLQHDILNLPDGDATGEDELIDAWFHMNQHRLPDKMDGYGFTITENEARGFALRGDAERQLILARRYLAIADKLKKRAVENFGIMNLKTVDTGRHVFTVIGNGGVRPLVYINPATGEELKLTDQTEDVILEFLPPCFHKETVVTTPSGKVLRAQLENYLKSLTDYQKEHGCDEETAFDNVPRPEALKYARLDPRGKRLDIK